MFFILYIASISLSSNPLQGGYLCFLTPIVAYNGAGHHAWEIAKEEYYRWLKVGVFFFILSAFSVAHLL